MAVGGVELTRAPSGAVPGVVPAGEPRARPVLSGQQRVWLLSVGMLAVGVALYAGVLQRMTAPPPSLHLPWLAVAALFALAEMYVVHVQFMRDNASFSLSEIALVLGLFFVPPELLPLAHVLGGGAALVLHRRQVSVKLWFNLGHFFLSSTVAAIVFTVIHRPAGEVGAAAWGAAFAAAGAASAIGTLAVFCAISLSSHTVDVRQLARSSLFAVVVTVTNTSLALVGVTLMWTRAVSGWLLAVPCATLLLAYRGYVWQSERKERLEFLYRAMQALHRAKELEPAMDAVLKMIRETFRAEIAEIVIAPNGAPGKALRSLLRDDGEPAFVASHAPPLTDETWREVMYVGRARRMEPPERCAPLDERYDRYVKDAMIVPLRGETKIVGVMIVANRLGDVGRFSAEDLLLFETLADHVGVSLENVWLEKTLEHVTHLKEQLKRQALYDSITGLANRMLFTERVEHALQRRGHHTAAVLFIDVDDFKTINDSLGHEAGDTVLAAIAERLRACLRPEDTPARLGGDEFGVLIEEVAGEQDAIYVAARILDALRAPFVIEAKEVFVHASIGIALGWGAENAQELLRNADVAMYMAKRGGKGIYEVFRSEMYVAAVERLQLGGDLRRALERDEFSLVYQPLFDLATGELTAIEALLRWDHPTRGSIPPEQFIALAEETGLIVPIGRWVIEHAVREAVRSSAKTPSGRPLRVHVNVSARQLQQPSFRAGVAEIIREASLPPSTLVLELTESMLMDAESILPLLEQLKRLGVLLAIDDFGTGYSNLSYLQRLPINILKIDRRFVGDASGPPGEPQLMRAIVQIARTLELETVAEGIETPGQLEALRRLGCDLGQGYHLHPPVTSAELERLVVAGAPVLKRASSA